jgi:tetratricopeptide (TPR) repeat protein
VFYADTSDLQKAVKDFDRAISLNPLFYDAYYQRAVVKVKLLQFGSALQDAWKLIEIAPNRRESYDMTTELSMRTGRPDIARKLLDQEIKLFPQYAFAYDRRSAVCELLGDKKQSEEDSRKATELGRLGQVSRTPLGE